MRFLSACLLVLAAAVYSPLSAATYEILNRWTVDLNPTRDSLEHYKKFDLEGITLWGDYFFISTSDARLEKRHLKTGEVEWSTPLEGISHGTWTYSNGILYGGDTRGTLYAIAAEKGNILWKTQSKGMFFSRPLI